MYVSSSLIPGIETFQNEIPRFSYRSSLKQEDKWSPQILKLVVRVFINDLPTGTGKAFLWLWFDERKEREFDYTTCAHMTGKVHVLLLPFHKHPLTLKICIALLVSCSYVYDTSTHKWSCCHCARPALYFLSHKKYEKRKEKIMEKLSLQPPRRRTRL